MTAGLAIGGYLPRADARDVLVLHAAAETPRTLATGSPRRRLQVSLLFPQVAFAETQVGAGVPGLDGTPEGLAFAVAAAAGLPNEIKQDLLEMLSERDRVVALTEVLTGPAGAEIRAREIEQRASGNGKVDHL